jgi:hypothetical protein
VKVIVQTLPVADGREEWQHDRVRFHADLSGEQKAKNKIKSASFSIVDGCVNEKSDD